MEKLLFTELRVLKGSSDYLKVDAEVNLEAAFVDNENIEALGYALSKEGIVRLAREYAANPKMTPLHIRIKEFEPDIEASPMYPNFPIQVLEMDELELRVNQLIHYLTTYGREHILTAEVRKGWLPETETLMEREDDKQIVNLKTLDYLPPREVNNFIIENLVGRNERLLPNELKLAKEAIKSHNRRGILSIPFKENIGTIFGDDLLNGPLEERYEILSELSSLVMKHPGDVLDLVEHLVILNKYKHFKTSLKRGLVRMIEVFPTSAVEENLASNRWSNKFLGKGGKSRAINRNIALIDYLSFSKFSKNAEAMGVVNDLKDGSLLSWNQKLEKAYDDERHEDVLRLLNQRPGIYFRQINRLHKQGVPVNLISEDVKEFAQDLKTQSIVSALNNYEGSDEVVKIFYDALICNLNSKDVDDLAGKKVFVEQDEIDFSNSKLSITDKFEEGGYIQSGMAIKIPDDAKFLRFFTYWDDSSRIDIDLHAAYDRENNSDGHIGWNGSPKVDGLTYSGDITHSGAAEYIDIDLQQAKDKGVSRVQFNINSYTGIKFRDIETIFSGLMVLGKMGQKVKLYDQKNILFRHDLENNSMATNYGFLDLEKGLIRIIGTSSQGHNDRDLIENTDVKLSIASYLSILLATQGCKVVTEREDADLVLGLGKSSEENYVSLIDNNFFM